MTGEGHCIGARIAPVIGARVPACMALDRPWIRRYKVAETGISSLNGDKKATQPIRCHADVAQW